MRAIHPVEHAVDAVRELGDFRLARGAREPGAQLRWTDGARLAATRSSGRSVTATA